jgi:hypothetical protein
MRFREGAPEAFGFVIEQSLAAPAGLLCRHETYPAQGLTTRSALLVDSR